MNYIELTPNQLRKHRDVLIRFIKIHGDNRITHRAIQWLRTFDAEQLRLHEGTVVYVAMDGKLLCGLVVIANYGIDESFVVVHKDYRHQSIATDLIQKFFTTREKVYGRVALDNIPSIKMCFANGMVAFALTEGPTGKPTLWFGYGNWSKEDVE